MTPVLHFSAGSISLLNPRKNQTQLKKCSFSKWSSKPQPFNFIQFYNQKSPRSLILKSAIEADVAVEPETSPNPATNKETKPDSEKTEPAVEVKQARKIVPRIIDADLIQGNKFKGVVRAIQDFGLFVDIGSFSDGLVHISEVSSSYVKEVKSLFTVNQEVEVYLLEANKKTRRISLSMRDPSEVRADTRKGKGTGKGKGRRRSVYNEGALVYGTILEVNEKGATISLPEGGEGFLPKEEMDPRYGELEAKEDLEVRILEIDDGLITLTMKEPEVKGEKFWREDDEDADEEGGNIDFGGFGLFEENDELVLTDELKRPDLYEMLSDLEVGLVSKKKKDEQREIAIKEEGEDGEGQSKVQGVVLEEKKKERVLPSPFMMAFLRSKKYSDVLMNRLEDVEYTTSEGSFRDIKTEESVSGKIEELKSEEVVVGKIEEVKSKEVVVGKIEEVKSEEDVVGKIEEVKSEEFVVGKIEEVKSEEDVVGKIEEVKSEEDVSGKIEEMKMEEDVSGKIEEVKSEEDVVGKIEEVKNEEDDSGNIEELKSEEDSNGKIEEVKTEEEASIGKTEEVKTEVASSESSDQGREIKATISPALVKQLREETGAGMMDCKNALTATNGDIVKAQEYLRKKGLLSADKKASRATAEGRIGAYVHDGRIGVLVEVNCETDFVSRGGIFTELVEDLAMQVAACPKVTYLSSEDVPAETVQKEKEIEMQREDILSKPENIRERIVEGRIKKRLEEFALLDQPFIKNDKMIVKDYVKQTIATIGENIKVNRFVRFNLGEGLEKKSQDFAAEVAAQTVVKSVEKEEKAEATETIEKEQTSAPTPSITISPALVKQLRDETGAGMMDCKKALQETGGDIEKAQEYLRKKGLSSADKKSSRLASEGLISAYIHDARIGCLIEVNSETDFVARNTTFKELADDLAMQVVACPQVKYVSIEEIPASLVEKEKEIEMGREDLQSKPEQIRERIVEGRISKRLGELALLEQSFIKDDSITVKELITRTIASLGENIRVRRFVRFTLGENKE